MNRTPWMVAATSSVVALSAAAYLSLQAPLPASAQGQFLETDPTPLIAETSSGERRFTIEVADDPAERSTGLMFRKEMADDHGMLFVFEQTQPLSFWMKNTPMRLDLIFVGQDGKVRAVRQGEPFSEAAISPREPVRFVLELKAGTAEKTGIVDGTELRHPLIDRASGAGNPAEAQ
ncbi:DUF192 domain-containing protein [Pseudaminobacter sp. 19-2017]|uniref:DUF192 domain-containing protein n=1 Tax=Pseudaminobacter soli (ex Zhang et al. 2022) TaxID=2831468 RepID=A0A942E124_9HYPH|nr:DUF192 domain-containing protein [Pseudaminobacter soli]MBS3649223.1 DUF192 domain-containing protein [Pseudaminobacter soli]